MTIVLDASPLIYLAKLDAFDIVEGSGTDLVIPATVLHEAARQDLAFRHPEVALIETALREGQVRVLQLDEHERADLQDLSDRVAGLHRGELEVLALGRARGWSVCLHEHQASRLAQALGIETVHLVELLFRGTRDDDLLRVRLRRLAALTNLAAADLDRLLGLLEGRKEP